MRITSKQLHNLLVKTQSGQELGALDYFDIEITSHTVQHYYITQKNLVERFLNLGHDLMIHPAQVISITAKEMIVHDSVVSDFEQQRSYTKKKSFISSTKPTPTFSSKN